MKRKLLQYGWISGPVDCRCSDCDWSSAFIASDTSVPAEVLAEFEKHECKEYPIAPEAPIISARRGTTMGGKLKAGA
jgi:hypothetical protein